MLTSSDNSQNSHFISLFQNLFNNDIKDNLEMPIRQELLNKEELSLLAQSLSNEHEIYRSPKSNNNIYKRFQDNQTLIDYAYTHFCEKARQKEKIPAGAEWLLDNYYVILEQIQETKKYLPKGYYNTLPKLKSTEFKNFPRIYHLVVTYISRTDALLDEDTLISFINSYQTESELSIGELWAVPIMLRLALIENLRRAIQAIWRIQTEQELAKEIISSVITSDKITGTDILLKLAEKLKSYPHILKLGAVYLIKELNSIGVHTILAQQWIEEKLREQHIDPHELDHLEQYIQAANQISISNTVSSLRNMGVIDWHKWFENVSKVDALLRSHEDRNFSKSDFISRNNCRNTIEAISTKLKIQESEVVKKLFNFFENLDKNKISKHEKVLMYYLIDEGKFDFFNHIGYSLPLLLKIRKIIKTNIVFIYLSTIWIPSVALSVLCFLTLKCAGVNNTINFIFSSTLLLPLSEFFIQMTQWTLSFFVKPKHLPKLNYELPIDDESRTIVIINTILKNNSSIESAINELEVKYLVNKDENISYAILADFPESDEKHLAIDDSLVEFANVTTKKLNDKYFPDSNPQFFLFFRERTYSESESIFMGWERKRGKVVEFNNFLINGNVGTFIIDEESKNNLKDFKYVITLDADTILPANSVKKLIGAISHPLNSPILNKETNTVVNGYTIIQPQLQNSLSSINVSPFSQLISSDSGIDPYSSLTSEVYQDVFGEGTFTGKGIYDLHVFEEVLGDKIPENALLSHDLFEGNLVRVGLATDITLIENIPSKYNVELSRHHRWTRGDWQLFPWLLTKVPNAKREKIANPIRPIGLWKMIDNLRRSLFAPITLLQLFLVFFFISKYSEVLFLGFIAIVSIPLLLNFLDLICRVNLDKNFIPLTLNLFNHLKRNICRVLLTISFLPKNAELMLNAIIKTLYRVYISKKDLLEWLPADIAERNLKNDLLTYIQFMWPAALSAIVVLFSIPFISPMLVFPAVVISTFWLASPIIAYFISKPIPVQKYKLKEGEKDFLLKNAYNTWKYFDSHLTEEDNYLIPDNLQTIPEERVAHRTSPTNIGLSLLSIVSAYDLGFISLNNCIKKIENSIDSIKKLEKFSGHLFNWYDTQTTTPLHPRYISFVDSGNLVAYYLALKQSAKEFFNSPIIKNDFIFGSSDKSLITYSSIYQNLIKSKSHKELVFFQEITPWYENILLLRTNFFQSLPERVKEKLEGIIHILESKEPTLTLTKKINNRIIDLIEDYKDKSFDNQNLEEITAEIFRQAHISNNLLDGQAESIRKIIFDLNKLVSDVDFRFLYNTEKNTFSIGYMLENASADNSYYDLLASEARLGSLTAIALGQVPIKHWFHLGRNITSTPQGKALYSWTGTMFEYLLPNILTKDYRNTLITESNKSAVEIQIQHGKINKAPWGISESAHAGVDFEQTYQYKAFGVPELGLKRGLGKDLVVSPYSTFLSLSYKPKAAIRNLKRMEKLGGSGKYGFYESIDFTPERLSANEDFHVVKTFIAHHQGMSLISINNFINDEIFQERFHSEPKIKSVEVLLHEKFPITNIEIIETDESLAGFLPEDDYEESRIYRQFDTPHTVVPQTQLLSNSNYSVLIDNSGSGKSFVEENVLINTWKEDATQNNNGIFVYLKDLSSNEIWSNTYQPTTKTPDFYEATFTPDKVDFKRIDHNITCSTEITVSPEHNLELRKLNITNLSSKKRKLQITSFAEVALANQRAFNSHPAFLRTFIQTSFNEELDALIFVRKPRSDKEKEIYMFHQLSMPICWDKTYYDTDRRNFIGRYHDAKSPISLNKKNLDNIAGDVLDPSMSLQTKIEVAPGFSANLTFVTGFAHSLEEVHSLLKSFHAQNAISRTFDLSWSKSNIEIRNEYFSIGQTHRFQKLANALVYSYPGLTPSSDSIKKNKLVQSNLWRFGISGDNPIVLLKISDPEQINTVKEMLLAHEYLRRRGLRYDLVILNEYQTGYFKEFYQTLEEIILISHAGKYYNKPFGIYLREKQQLSNEEIILLQAVAKVVIDAKNGNLKDHLITDIKTFTPLKKREKKKQRALIQNKDQSHGKFINNGKTYQIKTNQNCVTPTPWSNIIANPDFGTMITDSGSGYTWAGNSRENRITNWSNDPVTDPVSEAFYIKDTDTQNYWSPTPKPVFNNKEYITEHSIGTSSFMTENDEVKSEMTIFISKDKRIKWNKFKLTNKSSVTKNLEIYSYSDLTLGVNREDSYRYIQTGYLSSPEFLYAQNHYNNEFSGRVAFAGSTNSFQSFSCNRVEFIGRNRTLENPVFLNRVSSTLASLVSVGKFATYLSGNYGSGFDPAFIIKTTIKLKPNSTEEFSFFLGEADTVDEAKKLALYSKVNSTVEKELSASKNYWIEKTQKIQINTPSESFNTIMNSWLSYQNLSCRIFGRSAFYQSGGAIGFRDQLQDSLSALYIDPKITRDQIILNSKHQFIEGDVQHWWHPPTGKGTRTRISDDLLWMPYAVCLYVNKTGDKNILNEITNYITSQTLQDGQHDLYIEPQISEEKGTILDHCIRAIEYSMQFGEHGIPLIRGGDWNDGMDEVGKEGKGESVWLGWFFAHILNEFASLIKETDFERASRYEQESKRIVESIEKHSWDGDWYLRAFYDDGTPLGSSKSKECQIDSLAQSWSIITKLGDKERAKTALSNVHDKLVDKEKRIIKLLTPAFDKTEKSPGYIKSYLPGVRENGAQYTHAATWVILATAMQKEGNKAFELFQLINPVDITKTEKGVTRYQGEPYAMCGDVLSNDQHPGRAGWSWYTGSAGWLYRVGLENIIGFSVLADGITINPCIPKEWKEYSVSYKHKDKTLEIKILNPNNKESGISNIQIDNNTLEGSLIPFSLIENHNEQIIKAIVTIN